jgi:hypothetical protein
MELGFVCGDTDGHAMASTEMALLRKHSAARFSLYHSIGGNEMKRIKHIEFN